MGGVRADISCACHENPYNPCSIPGGCGSAGCDHGSRSRADTCVVCPAVRPDSEPRLPHNPPVCDGDRRLLNRWLGDIADLVAELTNPEPPIVDDRQYERFGIVYFEGGHRHVFSKGMKPSDPLAALGGAGPINSRSLQPHVTGSHEQPTPINTSVIDLTAARRINGLGGDVWPEDQVGHLSAATVLDEWCRDIRERVMPEQHLPAGTVDEMVMWLRARLEVVCDRYPEVATFADACRVLRGALRGAAGQIEPKPEHCEGIACPRCDLRALATTPGDDYRAQCGNCGTLLTDDEYDELVVAQGSQERAKRSPEEIHDLLRRG